MTPALHGQAHTAHLVREEIKNSTLFQAEFDRIHNVTRQTIRKWQNLDSLQDKSHAAVKMCTTLSPKQEPISVELRQTLRLSAYGLLTSSVSSSCLPRRFGRRLCRHGASELRDLVDQESTALVSKRTFKDYEPGFVRIDIQYLHQKSDEASRRYLFLAIDRATRWSTSTDTAH